MVSPNQSKLLWYCNTVEKKGSDRAFSIHPRQREGLRVLDICYKEHIISSAA